jgi:hypothetical protein
MKRIILTAAAALLVTVPAAIGLVGNTSFAQSVPVRVPPQATLAVFTGTAHGAGPSDTRTTEPGDDKGGQRDPNVTEPGDDEGGQRSLSTASPTDDKGGQQAAGATGSRVRVPGDSGSGKGQNGGHGGKANRSGGKDDGPGHP